MVCNNCLSKYWEEKISVKGVCSSNGINLLRLVLNEGH